MSSSAALVSRCLCKATQLAHQSRSHAGNVAEEEVMYTLFNLAQFLGYIEVVRREGPREDAFLQAGNPQGSDTLATLVEGLRFVMSAASGNLVVSDSAVPTSKCLLPATSHLHPD